MAEQMVFKVLQRRADQLVSCNNSDVGLCHVVYPLDTWVSPNVPNTPLLAFADWLTADEYAKRCYSAFKNIELWRATAEVTPNRWQVGMVIAVGRNQLTAEHLVAYWAGQLFLELRHVLIPLPEGTLLCDRIKLEKRMS